MLRQKKSPNSQKARLPRSATTSHPSARSAWLRISILKSKTSNGISLDACFAPLFFLQILSKHTRRPRHLRSPYLLLDWSITNLHRFNDFMVSWHMKDIRTFRWCYNPDCGSGQVYPNATQRRVLCFKCGHANCYHCRTVWHEGKSCKASTKARLALLEPDEQTELLIATTTNICPSCKSSCFGYWNIF